MKVREMLNKCKTADERYALVYLMADDDNVKSRYVGNEYNGWNVLDFECNGKSYTYSPRQGGGGDGPWYVTERTQIAA